MKINLILYSTVLSACCFSIVSCNNPNSLNNPPIIEDQIFTVCENSPEGFLVETVTAKENDRNQKLKYFIKSGNFENAFRIDSLTGSIYVNNSKALNYENDSIYELAVIVTDNDINKLSAIAKITIKLKNVIELPISENSLVAYYPFNGNANDESGNFHNGTVYGATLTTDRHNRINNAYEFDGVEDYINTNSTFDFEYRSVSLWFYAYDIYGSSPNNHAVIAQDSYQLKYGLFAVSFENGYLGMNGGGGGLGEIYISNKIKANRWYHVVLIRNGLEVLYYLSGDLVHRGKSNTIGSTWEPNTLMIIGAGRATYNQFFSGMIDDIAIYNRAISDIEINILYGVK